MKLVRGDIQEEAKCTPAQAIFRWSLEELYYDGYYEELYKALKGITRGLAKSFVNKWGKTYKIELDDVISECNVRFMELINGDDYFVNDAYSFYTNYRQNIKYGVFRDILKRHSTNSRLLSSVNYVDLGIEDNPQPVAVESLEALGETGCEFKDIRATQAIDNVLHKMHVEAIYSLLGEEVFTKHEEAILLNFKINPDVSIRGLAKILDVHPETMSRMLKKLRKKLKSQGLDWDEIL